MKHVRMRVKTGEVVVLVTHTLGHSTSHTDPQRKTAPFKKKKFSFLKCWVDGRRLIELGTEIQRFASSLFLVCA